MKIAMLAGEVSGDNLGAGLMSALRKNYPQAHFEGIGGERMIAQGFESLFPLEMIAVMGLTEVIAQLPALIRIRRALYRHFLTSPPELFIGIDAPDFNFPLERRLRAKGIRTVHYVSPQVWAWRQRRVHKIAHSVDLLLTLLPFEADFYRNHRVPVRYVGHPLADDIPLHNDRQGARLALGLTQKGVAFVALLPGSRIAEVRLLGPLFVKTALWLRNHYPAISFMVPAATVRLRAYLAALLTEQAAGLPVALFEGRAREVLAAADVALVASGTATLEALLSKCPMVVAYQVSPLSAWIASRLVKLSWFSLPNLLAGRQLVSEFFQEAATLENLGSTVLALLQDSARRMSLEYEFYTLHRQLQCNANDKAAEAITELLNDSVSANRTR
jgi:lipid-A-disaccharide synthase